MGVAIAAILAAVAVPSSSGAAAPGEDGQIGIRLLEAPVSKRDDPRAHMYMVDHLKPGSTITRRFEVLNETDQAWDFEVYPGRRASTTTSSSSARTGRATS